MSSHTKTTPGYRDGSKKVLLITILILTTSLAAAPAPSDMNEPTAEKTLQKTTKQKTHTKQLKLQKGWNNLSITSSVVEKISESTSSKLRLHHRDSFQSLYCSEEDKTPYLTIWNNTN